jgi:hypothetical protein
MKIQSQDHGTSDIQDYISRYPTDYPEPLWPDREPTADALALMAGPGSNVDCAVTGLPAYPNIIQHAGQDGKALLPTVAPSGDPGFPYQEPGVRQIVSWGESYACASTGGANMANQPVPHDGLGFVEEEQLGTEEPTRPGQLSTMVDPACYPQSLPPLPSTPAHSVDGEVGGTNPLDQYTTTTSNPSTYPESPLFRPRQIIGSTTVPTSLSLESIRDPGKSQSDKLCFCEDTFNSLDLHFFCRESEQCLCEPCMGWKLWSDRGRDIFIRAAKQEITVTIPQRAERRSCRW